MADFFALAATPSAPRRSNLWRRLMSGACPIVMGTALFGVGGSVDQANAQAVNLGGSTANNITPDGRTRTRVTIKDNHTTIHTDTVSKGDGCAGAAL